MRHLRRREAKITNGRTAERIAQADAMQCGSLGLEIGTAAHADCRMRLKSFHHDSSSDWGPLARPLWQGPIGTHKVAGIAVRITLKIILMLRLRFPEIADGGNFGNRLPRPEA